MKSVPKWWLNIIIIIILYILALKCLVFGEIVTLRRNDNLTCLIYGNDISNGVYLETDDISNYKKINQNKLQFKWDYDDSWKVVDSFHDLVSPVDDRRWTDFKIKKTSQIELLSEPEVTSFSVCAIGNLTFEFVDTESTQNLFTLDIEAAEDSSCIWYHYTLKWEQNSVILYHENDEIISLHNDNYEDDIEWFYEVKVGDYSQVLDYKYVHLDLSTQNISNFSLCTKSEDLDFIIVPVNEMSVDLFYVEHIAKTRRFRLCANYSLKYFLIEDPRVVLQNIIIDKMNHHQINMKSASEVLWKIHNYTFLKKATRTINNNISVKINSHRYSCISFYVCLNKNSTFNVKIDYGNIAIFKQIIRSYSDSTFNIKKWQNVKVKFDKDVGDVRIIFEGASNKGENDFWAIDTENIYDCNDFEKIQYILEGDDYFHEPICRTLGESDIFQYNFAKKGFLSDKIKCGDIFEYYPNCEGHKIYTENTSFCAWGYKGNDCNETCELHHLGIDCKDYFAVNIVSINYNSLNLTWNKKSPNNFDNISITYWPTNYLRCNEKLTKKSVIIKSDKYYHLIENLLPSTNYTFEFVSVGRDMESVTKYAMTNDDPNLNSTEIKSTQNYSNCSIKYSEIDIKKKGTESQPISKSFSNSNYAILIFIIIIGFILVLILSRKLRILKCFTNRGQLSEEENLLEIINSKIVAVEDFTGYVFKEINALIPKQYDIVSNQCKHDREDVTDFKNNDSNRKLSATYLTDCNEAKIISILPPTYPKFKAFWTLIWNENVTTVAALNEIDSKYWPSANEKWKIGHISIDNLKVVDCKSYLKQILRVTYLKQTRIVTHFYYKNWLQDFDNLITFVINLMEIDPNDTILIHCDGTYQKTSVIILSLIALRMAKNEQQIDLFAILSKVNKQNSLLVNSLDQYLLSHLLVVQYLNYDDFSTTIDENFKENISRILGSYPIRSIVTKLDITINLTRILYDRFNIKQPTKICTMFSDIVFRVEKQPQQTIFLMMNFWKQVLENNVNFIVSLNHILNEKGKINTHFWPRKYLDQFRVDTFSVVNEKVVENPFYNKYRLKLSSDDLERTVTLIAVKHWLPEKTLPKYLDALIYAWKDVFDNSINDVLVTCHDGVRASGLFIALCFLFEKMRTQRVCDVFSVVKGVRQYNFDFVKRWEHIEILYKAALEFVVKFEEGQYVSSYDVAFIAQTN